MMPLSETEAWPLSDSQYLGGGDLGQNCIRILRRLHAATPDVAGPRNVAQALQALAFSLGGIMNGSHFWLLPYDPEQGQFHENLIGVDLAYRRTLTRPSNLAEAAAWWEALAGGRPGLGQAALDLPDQLRPLADRLGARFLLGTRLTLRAQPVGLLWLTGSADVGFPAEEASLLELLAGHFAILFEHARLYEVQREHFDLASALREIGLVLGTAMDLDTVLDRILEQIARVAEYDAAGVLLVDPATGEAGLARARTSGTPVPAAAALAIADTPRLRDMAASRRPLVIPDTAADASWLGRAARSWAGAPVVVDGQVVAFLTLEKTEPYFYTAGHGEHLATFAQQAALAIRNARLYAEAQRRAEEAETLRRATAAVAAALERDEAIRRILGELERVLPFDSASVQLLRDGYVEIVGGRGWSNPEAVVGLRFPVPGPNPNTAVIQGRRPCRLGDAGAVYPVFRHAPHSAIRSWLGVPLVVRQDVIGMLAIDSREANAFTEDHARLVSAFSDSVAVALENARLFDETRQRVAELEALAQVAAALRQAQTQAEMFTIILREAGSLLRADAGALFVTPANSSQPHLVAATGPAQALIGLALSPGDDPLGRVWRTGQVWTADNTGEDPAFRHWALGRNLTAGRPDFACAPLKTADGPIGLLQLAGRPQPWRTAEVRLLRSIAEMVSTALHRAALHEQTRQRLERLGALRSIGNAISASLDLEVTLRLLLEQVTSQLRLDAAAILLHETPSQRLRYAAGHGFRTPALERAVLTVGEGYAGRAAHERRIINIPDLRRRHSDFLRSPLFAAEGFIAYYAVPLVARGQLRGVLEIFHRGPVAPDPEWLSFLEDLAVQAAIALDNAALFQELQNTNQELARSYEATLEGWVKALELRDQETTGHTQRVTQMTLRLSQVLGVEERDLVHIRRGAWLHDIGKMAIPDHILRKPGPLGPDEWTVMRQHPVLARDLLNPIPFLRPALTIPYYHHEKWNGGGYPEGLAGERIPKAARIFAVVDVWDALRSDRPYRRAWQERDVRQYLSEQSGQHFDPAIVQVFLNAVDQLPH